MKQKLIITFMLFLFSYFYIIKASSFIKEKDTLMQELKEKQPLYYRDSQDAIITENLMIPGVYGYKINLDKSYQKMKSINTFKESLLVYDDIPPHTSIQNIYDKVLIGNPHKKAISIILDTDENLLKILDKFIIENNLEVNPPFCFTNKIKVSQECFSNCKHTIFIYPIYNPFLSNTQKILKAGIILFYHVNENNYYEFILSIKYIKNNYPIIPIKELIKETIH